MWPELSDSDREFWRRIVAFAKAEVLSHVLEWDRQGSFPRKLWITLGEAGLLGLPFPAEYGGAGAGALLTALAMDAFAYGSKDLGIVNSWGTHTGMAGMAIARTGTSAQKEKYLPELAGGRLVAAFALSEPMAGSHAAALTCRAIRDGSLYVISGEKCFVTNGPTADVFIIIARTKEGGGDPFTAFIVERDTPGLQVGSSREKTCIRTSPMGDVRLEDCRIPAEGRLGEEGQAFETIVFPALDWDRCVVWAGRLGRLRTIIEDSVIYAQRRRQFGKPIIQHQAIAFKLADMKVRLDAGAGLFSRALARLDRGESVRLEAAIARLFLGEAVMSSASEATQIFGGYGFYPENHVERYYRDAKLDGIGGGTLEIQRLIISRFLGGRDGADDVWMSPWILP